MRARRVVRRFELWSVAKVAFLFHLFCGLFSLAACVGLWSLADRVGTRTQIESFLGDLLGTKNFQLFGDKLLRAAAGITGALVLLATVGTVLMAFVYNMLSGIFGGVVVSVLQERLPGVPTGPVTDNITVSGNAESLAPLTVERSSRKKRRRLRKLAEPARTAKSRRTGFRKRSDNGKVVPPIPLPMSESPEVAAANKQNSREVSPESDWSAADTDPTGSWMAPNSY